jgi:ubiquitin-conjugating enzyme E2 D/E
MQINILDFKQMALLRCLTKQLKEIENDPASLCQARLVDPSKDMFNWIGSIHGPEGSLFQVGIFHFPTDLPFKSPRIRYTTRVYHANISSQGDICLDIYIILYSPSYCKAFEIRSVNK